MHGNMNIKFSNMTVMLKERERENCDKRTLRHFRLNLTMYKWMLTLTVGSICWCRLSTAEGLCTNDYLFLVTQQPNSFPCRQIVAVLCQLGTRIYTHTHTHTHTHTRTHSHSHHTHTHHTHTRTTHTHITKQYKTTTVKIKKRHSTGYTQMKQSQYNQIPAV